MAITSRSRLFIPALLALAPFMGSHATTARPVYQHAYWTRSRMEHAIPMGSGGGMSSGPSWSGGGPISQDTGKAFFTLDGTDYVCSGAALATSAAATSGVVATAAHCVTDGYGGWATNWTFVPGYADGNEPYGSFTAQKFFVSPRWNAGMNETYDVAFVPIHGLPSGLPVAFGRKPSNVYVFGYPAEPPYTGGSISYCAGPVSADPADPGADDGAQCSMTAGDSGGPWLSGFDPATGTGTVVGVSAFKYANNDQVLYGSLLGSVAHSLYDQAESS
jgi:hypothetical protein